MGSEDLLNEPKGPQSHDLVQKQTRNYLAKWLSFPWQT